MLIKNALVFTEQFCFKNNDVLIRDGKIIEIGKNLEADGEVYDACGQKLIPGFINIHVHGAVGQDTMIAGVAGLESMAKYFIKDGVTSFVATSMTATYKEILAVATSVAEYMRGEHEGANLLGMNIEGPYLSVKYKGAHAEELLVSPKQLLIDGILDASENNIKLVTVAPETDGAAEFISKYKDKFRISLGHGGYEYDKCVECFEAGATQVTHLFNTMPPIHHRDKGLIHAAFEAGAYAELICDSIHVDKSAALMAIKIFGTDKICIITDGIQAGGQSDGRYENVGVPYTVKDGIARIDAGNLAGGTSTMLQCVKNVVSWGVSLEDAVRMATANPADAIAVSDTKGRIAVGLDADLVLLDENLNVKKVWKK